MRQQRNSAQQLKENIVEQFLKVDPAYKHITVGGRPFNDECSTEEEKGILDEIFANGGVEITKAQLEELLVQMSKKEGAKGNEQSPASCYEILFDYNNAACVNGKCYISTWVVSEYGQKL